MLLLATISVIVVAVNKYMEEKEKEGKQLYKKDFCLYAFSMTEIDINDLRKHGYMTPKEFVERITPGLVEYMKDNMGTFNDDGLSHPQDLVLNTVSYFEIMFHVISDLGVAPIEPKQVLGDPEFDDHHI